MMLDNNAQISVVQDNEQKSNDSRTASQLKSSSFVWAVMSLSQLGMAFASANRSLTVVATANVIFSCVSAIYSDINLEKAHKKAIEEAKERKAAAGKNNTVQAYVPTAQIG